MLLCGEENLREVVVFPMNQKAEDLLMGAPSEVTPKQLRELKPEPIRLIAPFLALMAAGAILIALWHFMSGTRRQ